MKNITNLDQVQIISGNHAIYTTQTVDVDIVVRTKNHAVQHQSMTSLFYQDSQMRLVQEFASQMMLIQLMAKLKLPHGRQNLMITLIKTNKDGQR